MNKMTEFLSNHPSARIAFTEFAFHYWIKVIQGSVMFKAFILDEKYNTVGWTKFYENFDECLEAARDFVDRIVALKSTL